MKNKVVFLLSLILTFQIQSLFVLAASKSDKETIDKARLAYEKSDLTTALKLYNQIVPSSDFWIEAMEEKAWTQLRQKNTDEATTLSRALLSDLLAPLVGPEPYLLQTLIEYRLCDYRSIFKTIKLFKSRYKTRTGEIQALADLGANKGLSKAVNVLFANTANLSDLKSEKFGFEVQYLPRYFYRDQIILKAVRAQNKFGVESRMKELAKQDLAEIEDVLRKLQLVETQVVQQVYAFENQLTAKRVGKFKNKAYNSDEMYFPYDGEIWLDEIDQLQSATEKCPVDPFDNSMPGRKVL